MDTVFQEWIKENIYGGHGFYWSAQDHTDVFGCISNDVVRSTAAEKWAQHLQKVGGTLAIEDLAAMCALTSNQTSKESIVEACACVCADGDKSPITSQCSNSIIARNIENIAFNTRKKKDDGLSMGDDNDDDNDNDDDDDAGDGGDYNGPPPPGFGGGETPPDGSSGGPPGPEAAAFMAGMMSAGGMPGFGGGGGMPGGGMPGFGGMNPMGGAPSDGFFAGGDDDFDDDNDD